MALAPFEKHALSFTRTAQKNLLSVTTRHDCSQGDAGVEKESSNTVPWHGASEDGASDKANKHPHTGTMQFGTHFVLVPLRMKTFRYSDTNYATSFRHTTCR